MKKFNLKGITPEAITGILVLVVALINAVLQMLGINTLPIENEAISSIVSGAFLIGVAAYNTWKNRNVSTASQISQNITDMLKSGELLIDDVQELMAKVKNRK